MDLNTSSTTKTELSITESPLSVFSVDDGWRGRPVCVDTLGLSTGHSLKELTLCRGRRYGVLHIVEQVLCLIRGLLIGAGPHMHFLIIGNKRL